MRQDDVLIDKENRQAAVNSAPFEHLELAEYLVKLYIGCREFFVAPFEHQDDFIEYAKYNRDKGGDFDGFNREFLKLFDEEKKEAYHNMVTGRFGYGQAKAGAVLADIGGYNKSNGKIVKDRIKKFFLKYPTIASYLVKNNEVVRYYAGQYGRFCRMLAIEKTIDFFSDDSHLKLLTKLCDPAWLALVGASTEKINRGFKQFVSRLSFGLKANGLSACIDSKKTPTENRQALKTFLESNTKFAAGFTESFIGLRSLSGQYQAQKKYVFSQTQKKSKKRKAPDSAKVTNTRVLGSPSLSKAKACAVTPPQVRLNMEDRMRLFGQSPDVPSPCRSMDAKKRLRM